MPKIIGFNMAYFIGLLCNKASFEIFISVTRLSLTKAKLRTNNLNNNNMKKEHKSLVKKLGTILVLWLVWEFLGLNNINDVLMYKY